MGHELNYGAGDHIAGDQEWEVKAVDGKTVFLQLAGQRAEGGRNAFALKHLMTPSSKEGRSAEDKAARRLMHRVDKAGAKAANPFPGAKAAGGQSRGNKYGKAMKWSDAGGMKNTVIDLGACDLDTVLTSIAKACLDAAGGAAGGKMHAEVQFPKACVITTEAHAPKEAGGKFGFSHTPAAQTVKVTFACNAAGDKPVFEVFHLG